MTRPATQLSDAFRWAIEDDSDASMASADWLARDVRPSCGSAVELLCDETIPLHELRQAKSVYKTLRIVGETSGDRRIGARLYAASIAAGLVRYERRISTQSDAALLRAMDGLAGDENMPVVLRELGEKALVKLKSGIVPPLRRGGRKADPQTPGGRTELVSDGT